MKKLKKLASILLAAVMVLALAMPAMAAESTTGTITVANNVKGRALTAYQIFSGTQAEDSVELGNIGWGKGINVEEFMNELVEKNILLGITKSSSAKDVADALAEATNAVYDDETAQKFAKLAHKYVTGEGISIDSTKMNIVDSGYYLIVDKTTETETDSIINLSLLQVTNGSANDIKMKTDIPHVEKDVFDNDTADNSNDISEDATKNNESGWGETADYDLNETFQFRLTAVIPSSVDISRYEKYQAIFHDKMSKGITFDGIVSVEVNGLVTTGYTAVYGEDRTPIDGDTKFNGEQDWTLTFDDIKSIKGVDSTRDTTIVVTYNAHLNSDAVIKSTLDVEENENKVYLEYSNEPNGDGTGQTAEDKVYVFTFELPGKKVIGVKEGNPATEEALKGAEFALYRTTGDGGREYVKLDENHKVTGWTDKVAADTEGKFTVPEDAGKVTSGSDGTFAIDGLDAGEYMLEETVTPAGFNTAKDTKVTITADVHKESPEGGATATESVNNGDLVYVENFKGATLPETGGIGTTIFYVLGSILVLGAVIVLVTKKRMSAEK